MSVQLTRDLPPPSSTLFRVFPTTHSAPSEIELSLTAQC